MVCCNADERPGTEQGDIVAVLVRLSFRLFCAAVILVEYPNAVEAERLRRIAQLEDSGVRTHASQN